MADGFFTGKSGVLAGYTVNYGTYSAFVQKVALVTSAGAADTNAADMATAIGSTDDAAWDGVAADASVISLLKAIALNTEPA